MTHVFAPSPSLLSRRRHHLEGGFLVHTLPPHTPPLPIFEQLFRASRGGCSTRRWFPTETKRTARETRDGESETPQTWIFPNRSVFSGCIYRDIYAQGFRVPSFGRGFFLSFTSSFSCSNRFFAREKPIRKISLPRWKLGSSDREVVVVVAAQEKGGQRKGKLEKYFLSPSSPSPLPPLILNLTHTPRE